MDSPEYITRENLQESIREVVDEIQLADQPKTRFDYFKSMPRPLLKWVMLALIPASLYWGVNDHKFTSLLYFSAALYGIRAGEKMFTAWNKEKEHGSYQRSDARHYRREPVFEDEPHIND